MSEFKIGDKVVPKALGFKEDTGTIRSQVNPEMGSSWVDNMLSLEGCVGEIRRISEYGYYVFFEKSNDFWWYLPEWLEKVNPSPDTPEIPDEILQADEEKNYKTITLEYEQIDAIVLGELRFIYSSACETIREFEDEERHVHPEDLADAVKRKKMMEYLITEYYGSSLK